MQHRSRQAFLTLDVVSPEKFYEAVLSRRPKTAVFDCDGTLWHGDSGSAFVLWTIETGLVSRETADWIDRRCRLYRKGEVSEAAICGEMVQMYAGLSETELRKAASAFFHQKFEAQIFPEMIMMASQLRASGAELWAVSSTNAWVVEAGASRFGIPPERVLAAKVRIIDDLITSDLLDVPTGEGKAAALRRVGLPHPDVVFGNSAHDAAMLAIAGQAVAIHPSAELLRRAEDEGWTIHLPAKADRIR